LPISSLLASLVRVTAREGTSYSSRSDPRGDLACLCHVALHLLDQLVRGIEAELVAQSLQECDSQGLSVKVAFEVEQVRLDQQAPVALESRPYADRDGSRPAQRGRRVDAVR